MGCFGVFLGSYYLWDFLGVPYFRKPPIEIHNTNANIKGSPPTTVPLGFSHSLKYENSEPLNQYFANQGKTIQVTH